MSVGPQRKEVGVRTSLDQLRCAVESAEPDYTRAEWLEWRRTGIGASEAAAIVGLSPWASPLSVWLDKTTATPARRSSEAMRWGNFLEEAVCRAFAEERDATVSHRGARVRSREFPWMIATLDALAIVDGQLVVLEAKTSNGRDGAWDDGVPEQYQVQVQHQLAVTGLGAAYVAVLLGGQDFSIHAVERDEEAIAAITEVERKFWHDHVRAGVPPSADGSSATNTALRTLYPAVITEARELPDAAIRALRELADAKVTVKEAEERARAAENVLMEALADAELGTVGGLRVCSWKEQKATRLDVSRLKVEKPDLYREYLKESSTRVLRIHRRTPDAEE